MIKGLYAAASAMLANLSRQGVLSHNVANLDTPGFKQLMVSLEDFKQTQVVAPLNNPARGHLKWIGDLGLGVEPTPEMTDYSAGALKHTGEELDLAIHGPGFFRVETPNGERYTRDGRFTLDAAQQLVTVDGYRVLDPAGQPIELPLGVISITQAGTIYVEGEEAGQIGLAAFADPENDLARDLPNTFAAAAEPAAEGEEAGALHQGYLELPNANPSELMTQMVAVTRAYEAAQKMVQAQDELLGKTISSLGSL
jgi:flagellar basal body rod protein FlgG